jgi:hypothetical protein
MKWRFCGQHMGLEAVGFDEAVTWCLTVVWRQVGLLVRVWV